MSSELIINHEFLKSIKLLISDKKLKKLYEVISPLHSADIATIVANLQLEESIILFSLFEEKISASILKELKNKKREDILAYLSPKKIAEDIIENLESDDAADLIGYLTEERKEKVFSHIEDTNYVNDISDLLTYKDDTAGGLMAKELIKVNSQWTTDECLKQMQKQAEKIKKVYTIYVVNNNNELLGSLSLRRLLLAKKGSKIKSIINKEIISVKASEDDEDVANTMRKYDLIVIPVVDEKNRLLGRITFDDIMDVVTDEAEKDYQMASGISEGIESNDNVLKLTKARLPWLIIGMIGGLLGAKVIGVFNIEANFELAFFIPLVAAMGGNIGVQSAAIVVQGLANKSISVENISQKLTKELYVGLLNGFICSVLILICSLILNYKTTLSITVSISLLVVIVFAALFGTSIPLILKKYKIDPALATGPFITTVNDILGLFIYFYIGTLIM